MIEQFLRRSLADWINPHLLNHSKFIDPGSHFAFAPLFCFNCIIDLLSSAIASFSYSPFTSPVFRFSFHQIRHIRLEK